MSSKLLDLGVRGIAVTGKSDAPVVQIANQFTYQSYFDTALLSRAILEQPQGQQIVPSTLVTQPLSGYAVGLHPSSQCPVAIRFSKGSQAGDSGVVTVKPGQIVRPNGQQFRDGDGRFSGFQYGLPFGWLGGGNVTLVVFRTSDAKVDWLDRSELIFHRQRALIYAPGDVPASTALVPNWPTAFPWAQAVSGADAYPQGGLPILSVNPTRIMMKLIDDDLAAPATMRMIFSGSTEFSEDATGVEILTDPVAYDVTWGTWTSIVTAGFPTQYQFQFLPEEAFKLGSINGQMILVSEDAAIQNLHVDIVRYGVL
jgi:hypothetical protein